MSNATNNFLTPVGRIVQGDAFEPQTKDMSGAPLLIKTGPNAGQPTQRYFVAVAFKKDDPTFATLWAQITAVARAAWPQYFNAQGQCTHPKFSWKMMDGDGVDDNGKPNNGKEGFAGHWVIKFNSSFPPKCFYQGRYQPQDVIQDNKAIRRGYYVRVSGTVEGNANTQKPGLYMNLGMIELVAQGPEIVSGPDAGAVFGGAPVGALPAGATPLPTPGAPAALPGMPAAAAPTPAAPAPLPVVPNLGFVAGPGAAMPMPGTPAPVGMPLPTPAGVMTAKAGGYTYEQLIAGGWTDATLRSNGLMA